MKSKFYSLLKVECLEDGKKYRLLEPLVYYSALLNEKITVPKGFHTDFASVPKALHWYKSPATGRHKRASVLHDLCYRWGLYSKETSDKLFKEAMLACQVSAFDANAMYLSVKLFGKSSYNQYVYFDSIGAPMRCKYCLSVDIAYPDAGCYCMRCKMLTGTKE